MFEECFTIYLAALSVVRSPYKLLSEQICGLAFNIYAKDLQSCIKM